jgi:hypothetical protein
MYLASIRSHCGQQSLLSPGRCAGLALCIACALRILRLGTGRPGFPVGRSSLPLSVNLPQNRSRHGLYPLSKERGRPGTENGRYANRETVLIRPIGASQSTSVGANQSTDVTANCTVSVGGNQIVSVTKNESMTASGDESR